jgi:hypothetical protein
MPEMILPGTYIEVRPEGLIAPGQVTVGNVGVLGTASKGPVGKPVLLSNYNDALSVFGPYDSFMQPNDPTKKTVDSLTLVRALELAFSHGASTVYAVRVTSSGGAGTASAPLMKVLDSVVVLNAASPGDWGNATSVTVSAPDDGDVLMTTETHTMASGETSFTLVTKAALSGRNRVAVKKTGESAVPLTVISTGTPAATEAMLTATAVSWKLNPAFDGASLIIDHVVDSSLVRKVTIKNGTASESYVISSGTMLAEQVNDPQNASQLVVAVPNSTKATADQLPDVQVHALINGTNGNSNAAYSGPKGLDTLLDTDVHIIVAAGQSDALAGAALDAHCQKASDDVYKRDRIAVVGSAPMGSSRSGYVDSLIGNTLSSDRVIFVAPGIKTTSTAADEPLPAVTLPGSYTAAAIAGMLATLSPHLSLTNKPVSADDLEVRFNNAELTELVQNRVTALEVQRGIRVLRGQTTSDGPFREITTRRIVDYAKYGVRSSASPYIGLLNNDRVRGALRATIDSFLKEMLDDEMLVTYSLEVTATRPQQIAGIAQVTIMLQPVFSINFIKVTMTLS